jgi:uncharacterized protein YndB with AHSA1/START domain
MTTNSVGTASIHIARPPDVVWAAIADVTRMGEWSPECVAARWAGDASTPSAATPSVGATFEGDNEARVGKRVVKRWTTTSVVTACEPGRVFEFLASEYTTWRYEFADDGAGTRVTESFSYEPKGFQGFMYDTVLRRRTGMTKGMRATLARVKAVLES